MWIHSLYILPVSFGYTAHTLPVVWPYCGNSASILPVSYRYTAHTLPVAWPTLWELCKYLSGTLLPVPYWYLASTLLLSHCGDPKGSEAWKLLTSLWLLNEENKQEIGRAFFASRFCLPLVVNEENKQEAEEAIHCEELFGLAFFLSGVSAWYSGIKRSCCIFWRGFSSFLFFLFFVWLSSHHAPHLPIRCGWVRGVVPWILIAFVNGCGVVLDFLVLVFLPHFSLVSLAYTHFSILFEFEAVHVIFTDGGFGGLFFCLFVFCFVWRPGLLSFSCFQVFVFLPPLLPPPPPPPPHQCPPCSIWTRGGWGGDVGLQFSSNWLSCFKSRVWVLQLWAYLRLSVTGCWK